MFVGSDALALAPFTDEVCYLEDGDWAVLTREGVAIRDRAGNPVQRPVARSLATALLVDKGNHRHFMAKEIHEQPEVVGHTLASTVDLSLGRIEAPKLPSTSPSFTGFRSRPADGLLCRPRRQILVRALGAFPVDVDIASEMRYRQGGLEPGGAALFISQSGETADTLATLRHCREQGQSVLSIVNVRESSIAREVRRHDPDAGRSWRSASPRPRPSPVSSPRLPASPSPPARRGNIDEELEAELVHALAEVRVIWRRYCATRDLRDAGPFSVAARDVLYLGRGQSYPIALEGAPAERDLLYPCRRLRRGRAEAWADRPHRRKNAGDRHRPARRSLREDRVEYAGGCGPRWPDHPRERRRR